MFALACVYISVLARFWVGAGFRKRPGTNGVNSWVKIGQESIAAMEGLKGGVEIEGGPMLLSFLAR